jgi:hypothetical protein
MAGMWSRWKAAFSSVKKSAEEVPPRTFELKLDLPLLRLQNKPKLSKKDRKPPVNFWDNLKSHPVELLRSIDRYLKRINSDRVPGKKRMDWMEQSLQFACPAIHKIYSEQYKDDALPETHDRREGLMAAINVCAQLSAGYKRLFLEDYNLPDSSYIQIRTRVRINALRVLELIRMEQRLRSMRYQKLPGPVWRDCNRIFFAIAQCEKITEPHLALGCLNVHISSKARESGRVQAAMTSIRREYLMTQLYGLMDTNTVSSRNTYMIDAYLSKVIDELDIKPDDGSPLQQREVIIYSNQKTPPYFERQGHDISVNESSIYERVLALKIGLLPLEKLLKKEQCRLSELFETGNHEKSKEITGKEELARLSVADLMCDRLHMRHRKEDRESITDGKELYVYNGFMEVFRYLVELAIQRDDDIPKDVLSNNALRDALAGRSALISSTVKSPNYGKWLVVDRSKGGVHIRTEESQFTTAMYVGQILVFSFSREGLKAPILGYVSRLSRSKVGQIEVTIKVLSSLPVPATVQSDFLSKNKMAFPALLLQKELQTELQTELGTENKAEIPRLILHRSHHLSPGTSIEVEVERKLFAYQIDNLLQTQREFILYNLRRQSEPSKSTKGA